MCPIVSPNGCKKKVTDTIGIVVPYSAKGYGEPFFSELLAGIGREASEQGLDLLVAYAKKERMNYHSIKKS